MSHFQQQQKHKTYKETFKGEKSTEKVPEKDLMVDLLDKNFKISALKMLKELKGDVERVFFFFFNINKKFRISEVKSIITEIKFTRTIQRNI